MPGTINLELSPSAAEAAALLAACGLASDDIEDSYLAHFVVARDGRVPVGLAGIQLLGEIALLRSVAVLQPCRSTGLGSRLLRAAEQHARDAGVSELFLLTNDRQGFFAAHGYLELSRCDAPAQVQATTQFGSTCCSGATLMRKTM